MQKLLNKTVIFFIFFISIYNTYGDNTLINDSIKPILSADSIKPNIDSFLIHLNNSETVTLFPKRRNAVYQAKYNNNRFVFLYDSIAGKLNVDTLELCIKEIKSKRIYNYGEPYNPVRGIIIYDSKQIYFVYLFDNFDDSVHPIMTDIITFQKLHFTNKENLIYISEITDNFTLKPK
jgi:hypothetical protein